MSIIFIIFLVALLFVFANWMRVSISRSNVRDRLSFGFDEQQNATPEINLSAGDYGLVGSDKLLYFLTHFLSTPLGYLALFGLGAGLGLLIKYLFGLAKFSTPMIGLLLGVLVTMLITWFIKRSKRVRSQRVRFELPNALQSIVAVMESGLAFESALQHVVRESNPKHPLYFDLAVMMDAMQQGRRRNEALKLWSARANERSVTDVVAAMIQADQTGAALGGVLRHHATTQLKEIESELLKKAERIPIYMMFPMMLCILPPILMVAVGPSAIRIIRMFQVIMSRA